MTNVTTDAICKAIDATIREQWSLGADRATMSIMVQNAVRDLLDSQPATDPELADDTITARVAVVQRGRPTLGVTVTVTVGEWGWPAPREYDTLPWVHRASRTLRDHGWSVAGEPRLSTEPGVYEVPVRKIETNET